MKAKKYTRCDLAMLGISTYGLAISVWASFGDIPRPLQGRGSLAVAVVLVYVLIRDRRAANK
ncbi:hypothetical protein [Alistipes onderdonkii]|uniref:hypothetical protein n=1 Tax=Alistipes onderdonkii TaxID=328813 RepID=UPI0018A94CE8|nr:hypothetical protein [Alistipes onderdonkii]